MDDDLLEREREALQFCLGTLSEEHRNLVLMPYVAAGGLTQVAAMSKRSANSVYKLLGRLREKLRQCVERRLAAEGGVA